MHAISFDSKSHSHSRQFMVAEGKRKGEQVFESSGSGAKIKRAATDDQQKTHDLVILGLAYTASETDINDYFGAFGQVLMTQVGKL